MELVICYDIADDRRRSRVASALLDFGRRVQESVFVAYLDDELEARMKERIASLIDADWDRLHVFSLCEACRKGVWAVGLAEVAPDPEWYVV